MATRRVRGDSRSDLRTPRVLGRILSALLLAFLALALTGGGSPLASGPRTAADLRLELEQALAVSRPLRPRLSLAAQYSPCEPATEERNDDDAALEAASPDSPGTARAGASLAQATLPTTTCAGGQLPTDRLHTILHAAQRLGHPASAPRAEPATSTSAAPETTAAEPDHLRGLLALVAGPASHADRAVRHLERALAAAPGDPSLLNDLAVAYALRAGHRADPRDLLRALAAADRASRLAHDAPAPAFNRALFLDALHLHDAARVAWQRYLARFDEHGFRDEATAAVDRLRHRLAAAPTPRRLHELTSQVVRSSPDATLALTRTDLQRARELAMEPLLGAWADARHAGDLATADRLLATARQLGAAILDAHGECSVSSMVDRIDAAAGDPRAIGRLAGAHAAYARGATLFRALRSEEALPHFERVREHTAPDHPVHLWARMGLGGVRFYRNDLDAAAAAFGGLLDDTTADTSAGCLHALAGRAAWGLGLTRVRQGRYTAALLHYQAAEARFLALDEAENLGAVLTLIGETHGFLGQPEEAWAAWFRALASLGGYRGSLRLHNLLWEMARTAAGEIDPAAALVLQDEGVLNAKRSYDPSLLPEALLWRGRFHAAAGDPERALADLDAAAAHNAHRVPGPAPDQVAADLQLARGLALAGAIAALQEDEPTAVDALATALDSLTAALDHYRRQRLVLPQSETLLARAGVLRRLGRPRQALADLDATLDLFRTQRAGIPDNHLRRSFTETVQASFEEALDLLVDELGASPEEALRLAEEARDVPFAWGAPFADSTLPVATSASPAALPLADLNADDAAVVVFTATPTRLHVWWIHAGAVELVSHPVDRADLEHRLRTFIAAVRKGRSLEDLAAEATALHRLLLPAAVADLPPSAPLYVVPDRILSALPFDLLRDPASGRLLIEDRPVALAPSLRSLAASLTAAPVPHGSAGAVTLIAAPTHRHDLFPQLPPLPGADDEARRIAALYDRADLLTGADATPEAVLAVLDGHPVLHYAGHAVFNPDWPTLSYLPLAPAAAAGAGDRDGTLFARDLAARPLHTLRLVVLSACTTLGPTDLRTAGISGLARPFLDAGATAVAGTLWPVTDADAGRLFPDFHRRFLTTGDAVHALWRAKLAIVHDPQSHPPARWAAFQIVGNSRTTQIERKP